MSECQSKGGVTFAYSLRSFTGYLRGTGKAEHTISNYQSDLRIFEKFIYERLARKSVLVSDLNLADLKRYSEYLSAQGFHENTRRRRLLTVRRLFAFLQKRGKLELDLARRVAAPHKVEKVPRVIDAEELLKIVRQLPQDSLLQVRNRALVWALLETGGLVSEVAKLRYDQVSLSNKTVSFFGKSSRTIAVSSEFVDALHELYKKNGECSFLFLGFNRYGPTGGSSISPRGVELVLKGYRTTLGRVTPRLIRHSMVVRWAKDGFSQNQIRERLGLKTDYAFRAYAPLLKEFKSSSETTSNADNR